MFVGINISVRLYLSCSGEKCETASTFEAKMSKLCFRDMYEQLRRRFPYLDVFYSNQ